MKRRQALSVIAGVSLGLSAALQARAQRGSKVPVIGLLDGGERLAWWAAFRKQMHELGYVEGKSIAFESRFAKGKLENLAALAQDLVRLDVAVIVTGSTAAALAAKRTTNTIPIVMGNGSDHVSLGLVASLARPGGNVTGMSSVSSDLGGERLEVLREIVPRMSRFAALWQRDNVGSAATIRDLQTAARASKLLFTNAGFSKPEELDSAFAAATRDRADAIIVVIAPLVYAERQRIADLALKHRLPSLSTTSEFVTAGLLVSYGTSYTDLFRKAAVYVDRILRGARPGELPIEQPTKFELFINLKTAKALGIAIPQPVLMRADRVID